MDKKLLNLAIQIPYNEKIKDNCEAFSCGDIDLDEFFNYYALLYENELLGKTYCWINRENPYEIMAMVTLSYNGINLIKVDPSSKNSFQRKIPNAKRHISYPGVLIGRLGVNIKYKGKEMHLGSQILDFIKDWFISNNKAACRFLIVDAYNNPSTLNFYNKNGFKLLYKTENKEKEAFGISIEDNLKSRILYFDLKAL